MVDNSIVRKKKILLTAIGFPAGSSTSRAGGDKKYLLTEARALIEDGHSVTVLIPAMRDLPDEEVNDGVNIRRFRYPLMRHSPAYNMMPLTLKKTWLQAVSVVSLSLSLALAVRLELKRSKYDLIWANWLQVAMLSRLGRRRSIPILLTLRGSDVTTYPKWFVRLGSKLVPDVLNMYGPDSEPVEWIEEFGFTEWRVPGVYRPQDVTRMVKPSAPNIVVIGRFDGEPIIEPMKGLGPNLFQALNTLLRDRPEISVTVIGDGVKLDEYRELLNDYGSRVVFTGWLRDFREQLCAAYCVIGGAGRNGVIMDTVPYGIPALISRFAPGSRFWEHEKNCLIYDPSTSESFAKGIAMALDEPELLMSCAERARSELAELVLPVETAGEQWAKVIDAYLQKT